MSSPPVRPGSKLRQQITCNPVPIIVETPPAPVRKVGPDRGNPRTFRCEASQTRGRGGERGGVRVGGKNSHDLANSDVDFVFGGSRAGGSGDVSGGPILPPPAIRRDRGVYRRGGARDDGDNGDNEVGRSAAHVDTAERFRMSGGDRYCGNGRRDVVSAASVPVADGAFTCVSRSSGSCANDARRIGDADIPATPEGGERKRHPVTPSSAAGERVFSTPNICSPPLPWQRVCTNPCGSIRSSCERGRRGSTFVKHEFSAGTKSAHGATDNDQDVDTKVLSGTDHEGFVGSGRGDRGRGDRGCSGAKGAMGEEQGLHAHSGRIQGDGDESHPRQGNVRRGWNRTMTRKEQLADSSSTERFSDDSDEDYDGDEFGVAISSRRGGAGVPRGRRRRRGPGRRSCFGLGIPVEEVN